MIGNEAHRNSEPPLSLLSLPPFPPIPMRVLQLLSASDVSIKELSDEIRADPAFSTEMLTLANSALFGFRSEIKTLVQAVALLGTERVKALALTLGMKSYLMQSFKIPRLRACWRHSLACALLAEELAGASRVGRDFGYVAGLMHDIGRLALAMLRPQQYAELLATAEEVVIDVLEEEQKLFEMDHCEAGGRLAVAWKLPKEFALVTSRHHEEPSGAFDIVALVHYSCLMADALGFAAVMPLESRRFEDIVRTLPERERERFTRDSKTLLPQISNQIHAFE